MAPADGGRQAQDAVAGEPGGGDPDGRDEAVRSRPRCDRHHGAAEGGDVPDRRQAAQPGARAASGDAINAVLAAAGYNFRRLLAWLRFLLLRILIALGLAAQLKCSNWPET